MVEIIKRAISGNLNVVDIITPVIKVFASSAKNLQECGSVSLSKIINIVR